MSNALDVIGHEIKVAAVDVAKGFEYLPHVVEVLNTAIKDEPAVKALVQALITNAGIVVADTTLVVTDKGVNLVADTSALVAAETFFTYFKDTFIPQALAAYKDIKADV